VTVCPAQLPYSWNGNSYSGEGTYAITLSTPNGCDSVPILSLTVAPFVTSLTTMSVCESSLPFTWNGQSFSSAGSHTVNLITSAGCDSIATLQLSIEETDSVFTTIAICENALPFVWNGDPYTASGVYTKRFVDNNGCDSISILNLTVNPVDTSVTTITICRSALPYLWNGQTINDAGEYFSELTSNAGCDSVAMLHLLVNELSLTTQQISICNLQLPYTWNGRLLASAGNYSDTLVNAVGCDSIVRLTLTVSPEVTTQLTLSICNNELPYHWNGQNITTAGNYVANFLNQAGCDSIVRLSLTVNPLQNSITVLSVCRSDLPFVWNGLSINAAGNYTANLQTVHGCDSVARLTFMVTEASSSTLNATVCSADLPFLWNGRSLDSTGTYRDTLPNRAGCDSILSLNLVVNPTPGSVNVPPPLSYCQFDDASPLIASADSNTALLWYTSATSGVPSPNVPVPSTAEPGTYMFYVSATNQNCEGPRATITVTVNRKPDLGDDRSLAVCYGETGSLTGLFNTDGLNPVWTVAGAPISPAVVSIPGAYNLVVENSFGCTDSANVAFSINPQVVADAGPDADVETNIPYRLQGSGNGSFSWYPPNIINNPNIASPLVTVQSDATLILTVTDNLGCLDTDTVRLRVLNGPTFYVPSAFTPDGDGLNDVFRPTPVGIQKLDYFRVYNRYGELVFETSEIGKGWNGIYKGIRQNGGNYVWALKGVDRTGRERMMKGNVVLIR
ncbi:MAG: gliding motility-associated C-terminal domain-containing protein, partial [Sphingobacteriales bacterium]